jgi:hypothetical protein
MSNFTFLPCHWANIFEAPKEAVYAQIETLDKEHAALLKQLKSMLV